MKLIDKFKNLFTEEVEEDVNIEIKDTKPKRDIIKETIEVPITKKEEPKVTGNPTLKKEDKFVFPVYFDDKDFDKMEKKPEVKPKQEIIKKEEKKDNIKEFYNKKSENKKNFKPTPIISPVYGILDKNYYKEDIVVSNQKTVTHYDPNRPITVDDIRKKAFGTLEDDLEKTLFSGEPDDTPKHGKDDEEIINELDFANAIEEDKKRDISKDNLKADIESLLNDKEFSYEFEFPNNEEKESDLKEEAHQEDSKEKTENIETNNESTSSETTLEDDLSSELSLDDNVTSELNLENDISDDALNDLDDDIILGTDEDINDKKDVKINGIDSDINDEEKENNNNEIEDIISGDLEMPNNVTNADTEIENAFADNNDLNNSDLFNLIDSMYDKEEE